MSCSAFGYQAIDRFGMAVGWRLLLRRMRRCGRTHRDATERQRRLQHVFRHPRQAGDCDLPSFDCDVGHGVWDNCSVGDGCSCDLPCDFSRKREKPKPAKRQPRSAPERRI
jgi:Putative membrane protein insertion efficiency factor